MYTSPVLLLFPKYRKYGFRDVTHIEFIKGSSNVDEGTGYSSLLSMTSSGIESEAFSMSRRWQSADTINILSIDKIV